MGNLKMPPRLNNNRCDTQPEAPVFFLSTRDALFTCCRVFEASSFPAVSMMDVTFHSSRCHQTKAFWDIDMLCVLVVPSDQNRTNSHAKISSSLDTLCVDVRNCVNDSTNSVVRRNTSTAGHCSSRTSDSRFLSRLTEQK